MPPFVLLLFALLVAGGLATIFRTVRHTGEKNVQNSQILEDLQQQSEAYQRQLAELEKRMTNIEAIVTDSKFVDPPTTGREAIDLQAEIRALKEQLNRR